MTNVEVVKTGSESNLSLLRRFTKRVQGAGVLSRVRSNRYKTRRQSPFKRKASTLKRIEKRASYERLAKLGKLPVGKK
jgi:ribosomal protein S21